MYRLKKLISIIVLTCLMLGMYAQHEQQKAEAFVPIVIPAVWTAEMFAGYILTAATSYQLYYYTAPEMAVWGNAWLEECGPTFTEKFTNAWNQVKTQGLAGMDLTWLDVAAKNAADVVVNEKIAVLANNDAWAYGSYLYSIDYRTLQYSGTTGKFRYYIRRYPVGTTVFYSPSGSSYGTLVSQSTEQLMTIAEASAAVSSSLSSLQGRTVSTTVNFSPFAEDTSQYHYLWYNAAVAAGTTLNPAESIPWEWPSVLRSPRTEGEAQDLDKNKILPPIPGVNVGDLIWKPAADADDTTGGEVASNGLAGTNDVVGGSVSELPTTEVGWLDKIWAALSRMAGTLAQILTNIMNLAQSIATAIAGTIAAAFEATLDKFFNRLPTEPPPEPPPLPKGGFPGLFINLLALIIAVLSLVGRALVWVTGLASIPANSTGVNASILQGIEYGRALGFNGWTFYGMIIGIANVMFGLLVFRALKKLTFESGR